MLKAKAEMRIQTIRCSSTDHKRDLRGALVCAPKPFFVISTLWGCSFLGQSHHCIGRGASIPDQEISVCVTRSDLPENRQIRVAPDGLFFLVKWDKFL